MARASTATVIGSLSALLFTACSSGDDGMNPPRRWAHRFRKAEAVAPRSGPAQQRRDLGQRRHPAPAPTAGTSVPTAGTGSVIDARGRYRSADTRMHELRDPAGVPGLPARRHQVQPGRHGASEQVHAVPPDDQQPLCRAVHRRDPGLQDRSTRAMSTASCRRRPSNGMQVGLHPHGDVDTYWQQVWAGDYERLHQSAGRVGDRARRRDDAELPRPLDQHRGEELLPHVLPHAHRLAPQHHHDARVGRARRLDRRASATRCRVSSTPRSGADPGRARRPAAPRRQHAGTLEKPPEDKGLYLVFPAKPSIIYNMHHFNFTDKAHPP